MGGYTCTWKLEDSLKHSSGVSHPICVLKQCLSLAYNLPIQLGLLTSKSQESFLAQSMVDGIKLTSSSRTCRKNFTD